MPEKEKRDIIMHVSETEERFLKWCRRTGFADVRLEIMDGVPKKIYQPIKSVRFDIIDVDKC